MSALEAAPDFQFSTLFGKELIQGNTTMDTNSTLKGKTVMVYFSAHWCPPCRGFTPVLIDFYNELKATNPNFELVFISSDRDQKEFDGYYGTMPFHSIPFSDRETKNNLSSKMGISG